MWHGGTCSRALTFAYVVNATALRQGGLVPRVLIVDDDDDVRMATQDAMERRGFEVVAVGSGSEALAYLAHDVPSIMLLDLHMDDMNGWEVLGSIRKNPRFAKTEIVVVTGFDGNVGAPVKVLRKPFKIDALMELLGLPQAKRAATA